MSSDQTINEMLEGGFLSQDEAALLSTPISEIPQDLRGMVFSIDDKVVQFVAEQNKLFVSSAPFRFNVVSDYVQGGHLKSMADGKTYDSKSKYYKSIKEQGLVIVGDEKVSPPKPKEVDWKKAVAETINRIEG